MIYNVGYTHCGSGAGVFVKDFATDKEFRKWLYQQFPSDEIEFKLIGIKTQTPDQNTAT